MKSTLFGPVTRKAIEDRVLELLCLELLNEHADFLSEATMENTRAAGDAIQSIIEKWFEQVLGDDCAEYSDSFARRAMADIAFKDKAGNYYVVDVKTHREDTAFNMPNLTSVDRLARFYEDDPNYFVLLIINYSIQGAQVKVGNSSLRAHRASQV